MPNFIFDLDDTLIATSEQFDAAQQTFLIEMAKLGFDRDLVSHIFIDIDATNVESLGYMPVRFSTSMGDTYEILSQRQGNTPNPLTRERLEDIGREVYRSIPEVIDGAENVLRALKNDGNVLYLWTQGDVEVQQSKLIARGLTSYFHQVYIFSRKTKTDLLQIIKSNHLISTNTWVVGDSIRSDINPALELGLGAIHITCGTWRYESIEPVHNNYIKLSHIRELLRIYPQLRDH